MGKKNLDQLFQEKLKDFSEMPEDQVWQSIEASLNAKKKSRKIIPIWWKLSGAAAVLLLGIVLYNSFENLGSNTPVITTIDTEKKSEENKANITFETQNSDQNKVVDTQQQNVLKNNQIPAVREHTIVNTTPSSEESLITKSVKNPLLKKPLKSDDLLDVQVASSTERKNTAITTSNKNMVAAVEFNGVSKETNIADTATAKLQSQQRTQLKNEGQTSDNITKTKDSTADTRIALNEIEASDKIIKENQGKKSIFDEIAEKEQEEVIVENTASKWSAGPSVAPVYYDAIGEGSPVHSIFVPNSKSGDINLSYGLSVAYAVNKKLSVRSGIHKVDYGYSTSDVEFSSSLESSRNGQIDNVNYALTSKNLVVSSKANVKTQTAGQAVEVNNSDASAQSLSRSGTMKQQFGYLEVPVELNYAILDKKFGINLIGGISSLFLVDNSISLNAGELITEMGEANNVNAVNFSTNVGFGVNYKFTSNVQLNIEPVFKYQLNTFSETDGTFNPFSVGVYSGLSFKF